MPDRVEVVRASEEETEPRSPVGGQPVFDVPGAHVGLTRLSPGAVTSWHHHGTCNFFGYMLKGTVKLESGPGGSQSERIPEGHFFRIPPHLVHRDVNDSGDMALIAIACVGEGPMSVNVDTPEG